MFASLPEGVWIAFERFYDIDFLSVIKNVLGPTKPHFRTLVRKVLLNVKARRIRLRDPGSD